MSSEQSRYQRNLFGNFSFLRPGDFGFWSANIVLCHKNLGFRGIVSTSKKRLKWLGDVWMLLHCLPLGKKNKQSKCLHPTKIWWFLSQCLHTHTHTHIQTHALARAILFVFVFFFNLASTAFAQMGFFLLESPKTARLEGNRRIGKASIFLASCKILFQKSTSDTMPWKSDARKSSCMRVPTK